MIKKGKGIGACVLLLMVCLVPGITVLAESEKMEGVFACRSCSGRGRRSGIDGQS